MLRHFRYSQQSKAVRLAIGRHACKAVAINAARVQALIYDVHDWNLVRFVAVVLRQNSIAYGFHEQCFFGCEKANGRNFLNPR
jgi:hypothetical protein